MAHGLFEAFFVARIVQGGGGTPSQRGALFCRFEPPGARGVAVPAADNLLPFCWPLGVETVKPSPYLVTCEFSFTLTGGDGQRLHGFCRKTHDTTHRSSAVIGRSSGSTGGSAKGGAAGLEQKRFPQVLCILSQHCWSAFFSKVLEVVDQLLAPHAGCQQLPSDVPAALFMASLPRLVAAAGPAQPPLGAVLRVPLPYSGAPISVDRMRRALAGPGHADLLLGLSLDHIELEVPPSLGNSTANAGVSLARLLWFLTPRQAVTLVASLLLERRIILVARDAETVSAAVHAANALLYPFRWQHIYLPLLPLALKDYLAAPMPYLAGVQADCLPLLRGLPLEEVVMIDLDCLGSCTPELGGPADDYFELPYARELEDVFEVVREHIKSPTEFDSSPKCTELLQDFFLRLIGRYRQFVRPDEEVTPAALALGLDRPTASSQASSKGVAEENPRAHGYLFDQAAFIAAQRRKDKVAAFLQQFRNSQMLEVFITERLKLAAEGYVTEDPFELMVTERNTRVSIRLGIGVGSGAGGSAQKGRFGNLLRKAGSAVKQGGGSLVASIQRLGTSQQEELQVTGRAHSGPNLSRLSPGPNGLARPSPGISAAAVVAHSHNSSFSSSRPGSRSSSYSNLHRASANLAVMNGGVEPSLEQLRAEMFFGADEEDDASSVASEVSTEPAPSAVCQAARSSPGPLEKAMGATRSFGSIFHAVAPPQPPMSNSRPSAQQQQLSGWVRQQQQQHSISRFSTTESFEPPQQLEAGRLGAAAAGAGFMPSSSASGSVLESLASMRGGTGSPPNGYAGSRGVAEEAPSTGKRAAGAAGMAASPASLIDLQSPGLETAWWQQKHQQQQQPYEQPQARPQQLFPDVAAGSQQACTVQRSNTNPGWATFGDAPEALATSFARQDIGRDGGGGSLMDASMGPLGAAMFVRQTSSGPSPADSAPPSWEQPQQMQPAPLPQQPPLLPQQHYQHAPPQPPPQRLPPSLLQQEQQYSQQLYSQHQQAARQQPQANPRPPPLQSQLAGVSAGWGPLASQQGTFCRAPPAATIPLPGVCRHSVHSPLAQGMGDVHRLASLTHSEPGSLGGSSCSATPRRSSSSGTSVVGGGGLHVQHDAFADVAAAAAVKGTEHIPSHRHTSSNGSIGSGNPFRDSAPQQPVTLSRQVTAGGRTISSASSFGEWSAAWPAPADGPLGAGAQASASVQLPMAELTAFSLSTRRVI